MCKFKIGLEITAAESSAASIGWDLYDNKGHIDSLEITAAESSAASDVAEVNVNIDCDVSKLLPQRVLRPARIYR